MTIFAIQISSTTNGFYFNLDSMWGIVKMLSDLAVREVPVLPVTSLRTRDCDDWEKQHLCHLAVSNRSRSWPQPLPCGDCKTWRTINQKTEQWIGNVVKMDIEILWGNGPATACYCLAPPPTACHHLLPLLSPSIRGAFRFECCSHNTDGHKLLQS